MSAAGSAASPPAAAVHPHPPRGRPPRLLSRTLLVLLVSLLVAVPCFWHTRLQAGDLSSHAYNAWLASRLQQAPVEGLTLQKQFTNVLFDLLLQHLVSGLGSPLAESVAAALAVLVFFWGVLFFCLSTGARNVWVLSPALAMITFGWTFHAGFFNYYLATGLCAWAAGCVLRRRLSLLVIAAALLVLAYTAHYLPLVHAAGLAVFAVAVHSARRRWWLPLFGAALLLIAVRLLLPLAFEASFAPRYSYLALRVAEAAGADQLFLFGFDYAYFSLAALALALFCVCTGGWALLKSLTAQLYLVQLAVIAATPATILLPTHLAPAAFLPSRLSLVSAVLLILLLCRSRIRPRALLAASALLAAVFFSLLYRDTARLNLVEDALHRAVRELPPGSRVLAPLHVQGHRLDSLLHAIDRACIGHCYSYANYEPSSGHFRLRATGPNPYVMHRPEDVWKVQYGSYQVKAADSPLYLVVTRSGGADIFETRKLTEGSRTRFSTLRRRELP